MAGLVSVRHLGLLRILVILALLALAGCSYVANRNIRSSAPREAPTKTPQKAGIYHVVKKGETLYRIGRAYGIDHMTLARSNRVSNTRYIRIGRRLYIPGANRPLPVDIITPIKELSNQAPASTVAISKPRRVPSANNPTGTQAPRRTARVRATTPKSTQRSPRIIRPPSQSRGQPFVWPVRGKITARFDPRHDSLNDGIDIAAPSGTPVRATLPGDVIYSDKLRGYGNLIILRHRDGYASVYAHNRRNLVRQGQKVTRRQVIAEVGATGRVTTPHLHFEIRRGNIARDPLSYLP